MKKIVMIMLVFSLILVGCSGGAKQDNEEVDVDVKSGGDEIVMESDEAEVTVTTDMNKSVDLPDGYPEDILPIYDDLFVSAAVKHEDGSFMVVGMSEDKMEDIVEFYEDIVKDGTVMMKNIAEDNYTNMGELDGVTYSVIIAPLEDGDLDYKTMVNLVITPSDGMETESNDSDDEKNMEESDDADDESDDKGGLIITDSVGIPDNYPVDSMPIISEKTSEIAITQIAGDKSLLGYMTKSSFEEVYDYYEEIFEDAEGFTMMSMGPTTMFIGEIDGIMFEVGVTENTPDTGQDQSYNVLVQVFYE